MNKRKKNTAEQYVYTIRRILLEQLLFETKTKNQDLAQFIGIEGAYISRYFTDNLKNRRNINDEHAEKIEAFFKLPKGYLSDPNNLPEKSKNLLQAKIKYEQAEPNYLDTHAGKTPLFTLMSAINYLNKINDIVISDYADYRSSKAIAITMPDQSMCRPSNQQPSICKNDILIVEPALPPQTGDIVLIFNKENEKSSIAELIELGNKRLLRYYNPEIDLEYSDSMEIMGVVTERQTRLHPVDILKQRLLAI